jgi:hypothetical protein
MSTANDTIVRVGSKLECFIRNLSPGKAYHMRVLAYSNGGDGRMSSPALTFQMGKIPHVLLMYIFLSVLLYSFKIIVVCL